jgi:hypothetical protein
VVTGTDPTALSVAASAARWPTMPAFHLAQGYEGAYVATIGLAARPPSPGPGGPLLLLGSADELDPRVAAELNRIFGATDEFERPTVYLADDVSTAIDDQLTEIGYEVTRRAPQFERMTDQLCPPDDGRPLFAQRLIVVDGTDVAARWVGEALATSGPVLTLDGALTDEQTTWLRHTSAVIESVYVVGEIPAEVQQQVAELVAGPAGFTTAHNPTAPPLS